MASRQADAIRFDNLTLGYDGHPAVHHLDGVIEAGDLLAICGPNGAGKSTLLKAISGALAPLSGALTLPRLKRGDVAYLPQAADIDRTFPINVIDLVAMGLWRRCGLFGAVSTGDLRKVREALAAVGLEGFEDRAIGTLSGGQLQRMLFARLLIQDAGLILLDEPFTAIDAKTTADLLGVVARWREERRTVLAVLHDLQLVRENFPQTLLIAREKIAWGKTGEVLTPDNLTRANAMIEAFDHRAPACRRGVVRAGERHGA